MQKILGNQFLPLKKANKPSSVVHEKDDTSYSRFQMMKLSKKNTRRTICEARLLT